MGWNKNYKSQTQSVTGDSGGEGWFKGMNWNDLINYSIYQILNEQVKGDANALALAVDNLESLMFADKMPKGYDERLQEAVRVVEGKGPKYVSMAKFRVLLTEVRKKSPEVVEGKL